MNIMNMVKVSATVVLLTSPFTVNAGDTDSGWFVGGQIGYTNMDLEWERSSTQYEDDSAVLTPFFGYKFNKFFALEGSAMVNLGAGDQRYSGAAFTPKFTAPIGPAFNLYVKGGPAVISYIEEDEYNNSNDDWWDDDNENWTGTAGMVGVGFEHQWDMGLTARFEYSVIKGELEHEDDSRYYRRNDIDATIQQASFGVYYQF